MCLRSTKWSAFPRRLAQLRRALPLAFALAAIVAMGPAVYAQEPIDDTPPEPPPWVIPGFGAGDPSAAMDALPGAPSAPLVAPSRADRGSLIPAAPSGDADLPGDDALPVDGSHSEAGAPESAASATPLPDDAPLPYAQPAPPLQPHSWELDAFAPDLATCCRSFVPSTANLGAPAGAKLTPLPRLVNGGFDSADVNAGWQQTITQFYCPEFIERPFVLVYAALGMGDWLTGSNEDGKVLPTETTDPQVAWLGGGGGDRCDLDLEGIGVKHRLVQTVTLPSDYAVRLQFDMLVQSAETEPCNRDGASVLANGVRLPLSIRLCQSAQTNQWSGRSVDLSRWRGQEVAIEFAVATNNTLNSNLWLDNVRLCGLDARLPAADRCPLLGWQEPSANSASLGGVSATRGRSYDPSTAVSHIGRVYITWADQSGASTIGEIYARRWNGVAWESVGSGSASGGGISNTPSAESAHPVIAVSPTGIPYLAWHEMVGGDFEIYVKQFDGTTWTNVGINSGAGGGISNNSASSFRAAITIASDGRPVVAWTDGNGADTNIYLRKWNGSAWAELGVSANGGGVSKTAGESGDAALAAGRNGDIYLAWSDATSGDAEIYVRRWNGSSWVEVGAGSASAGGISNNSDASYAPSIAVGTDGLPVVAWVDRSGGDTEIYVRKWTGTAWGEVGTGSATAGGISNNDGASLDPALVIGANNRPLIAWTDLSGFNAEIYVRHFVSGGWAPFGSGAAGFGGISNTPGFSNEPAAAIGRDGVVTVAWTDDSSGSSQIFLRRFSLE
jgi:hypothetical protein